MEYFTECPHCQNKFKVIIPNVQGEIYTTNCPKCFFQFTFKIPIQQFQYQQPQIPYQSHHNQTQTPNQTSQIPVQQSQYLQNQPQTPSQHSQTHSHQFQNLQSQSQKQNQTPQISVQQIKQPQPQIPNISTPQIQPSQFQSPYFQIPFFKKPSNYNIVGILLIISALLGYMMAGVFASLPLLSPDEANNSDFFEEGAYICGLSTTIFSSFALIGGVVAFTGRYHGAIIVGGVYGVLAIGFVIGAVLSVIALILFYKIKKENESFEF